MTVIKRCFQTGIIFLVLFAAHCSLVSADSNLVEEKQRLIQLRKKITSTRDTIRKMESEEHSVELELELIEQDYANITVNLDLLNDQTRQLQDKLKKISFQKAEQEKTLVLQQSSLANQLRAAYRSGKQEQWRLLLSQADPSKIARHMMYYRHLNNTRLSQINQVRELLETIQSLQTDTVSVKNALEDKQALIKKEQNILAKTKHKRASLLARLRDEISSQKQNLSRLIKNEKKLQQLISEISQSINDLDLSVINKRPFPKLKGRLPWPVRTYSSYKRRIINNQSQGLIIKTKEGTNVYAVAPGRIVFSDWMPGYGLLIIIDHGSSYLSLYANNQRLKTSLGTTVKAGDIIASAGTSGGRLDTALYFEIRKRKRQENPLRWLVQNKNK